VKVLDVNVDVIDMDTAIERIGQWIEERRKAYVCVAPVATVVRAIDDQDYQKILEEADMVTPDGMPVVWVARAKGAKEIERVCGPDLIQRVCSDPCLTHWRHFFFGATPSTLEQMEKRLRMLNPDIKIAGTMAPPFRDEAVLESPEVIEEINRARPDILWVGMGSPKQDFWMKVNRPRLDAPVIIGIGAAFDFLAGNKPRAPKWMQRVGLEWLFRLGCEPRRLMSRYVIGNSRFCMEVMLDFLNLRNKRT
ncbi:MAG TPA: WecB/TagA/CpsF family glycosyltransferase, partial [Candidatus Bathyarchaeia archaeon]|nr:WecB/TagA/CpsF family glycosyltransferase [Candidatus Bathyarchaeia archaeon]